MAQISQRMVSYEISRLLFTELCCCSFLDLVCKHLLQEKFCFAQLSLRILETRPLYSVMNWFYLVIDAQ